MRLRQLTRATAAAMFLAAAFLTNATILGGQQRPAGPFLDSLSEPGEGLAIRSSHARTGRATFAGAVRGGLGVLLPQSVGVAAEERARRFADTYGGSFGLRDRQDLELAGPPRTDALGVEHVRFRQMHLGIPVRGAEFLVHLRGPRVMAANATLADDLPSSVSPTVSAEAAQGEALAAIQKRIPERSGDAQLQPVRLEILSRSLLTGDTSAPARLAWFVELRGTELREFVWVDAETGTILLDIDQIEQAKNRSVYNLNHGTALPGTLVRAEGAAATGDADTDRAYTYSGDTYDYYKNNHNRDSYNNAGATLVSSVHYSTGYANAYWDGTQMVYGDGYAVDDVVGHELTHAVTEYAAGLIYSYQSGALNESYSDIFGETIDLTNGSGTDTAGVRWLIGEEIGAIRNMMTPTQFSQPGKMSDPQLYCQSGDNGGVHYNSGIPNHAYALMVDGGSYNGQTITGIGLTKAGKIQYRALDTYLTASSTFLDNYNAVNQACTDLIGTVGITANDCTQVNNALLAVEMNASWGCNPAPPPLCPAGTGTPIYSLQEGFEVANSTFTASSSSSTQWVRSTLSPKTGSYSEYGANPGTVSDHRLAMTNAVTVPAGGRFYFSHSFSFEPFFDGGVIEYSTDGGTNWLDAGGLIDGGKNYEGTIPSGYSNPLTGRNAFVNATGGYTATRLNLSSLAGQSVKLRFRVGTDTIVSDTGWFVDDIALYRCGVANPPTLTVAPNPVSTNAALTLTLANGRGGAQDWIALANAGDPDTTFSSWFYVGTAVTNTVFNKTAPTQAGSYEYRLFQDNGYTKLATGAFTVSGNNPAPAITTLNPSSVVAGSGQFTLTVTGTGFVNGAIVRFDGNDRTTSFGSATQLTATILAGDITSATTHTITVFNPTPGGGTSSGSTLTVTSAPATPTITSINPTSLPVGSAAQSLTVNGTNFVNTSVVRVNGNARTTTYGSATQITAALLASDFTSAGTLAITVFTPSPGGGTSNSVNLSVTGPTLTAAPSPVSPGAALTLTLANGAGGAQDWIGLYAAGAADTAYQSYFYVGPGVTNTVFNKTAPAQAGSYEYRLFINNTYTKTATAAFTVTVTNPAPTITSLNPSSVVAGSGQFTLTVNGTGFVNGAIVRFDGGDRTTSFGTATQLTATILAGDIASATTHTITVFNPTPGGGTSSGSTLTVTAAPAAPTITSINPTSIPVGSAAQSLTVNGTNFVNTSVVRVNGTARTTTFGSGNQLTAALLAGDLANAGTLAITVFTPTPGGGTSNSVNLTVSGPTLTVVPNPVNPSAALTLTLANGAGGAQDWIGLFAAGAPDTAYQSYFYVGAGVTNTVFNKTAPAQAGNYEYRLFINNGYTRTAAAAFTVAISNPVPTITSLSPSTATVGGPTFTLTVNGTNFVNGAIVRLDGSNRTTVFGSATQLTATIPDTDIASGGTHTVTVFNPAPGGGTSNGSTLAVVTVPSSPVPTITSINPTSIPVGSAAQSLTVNGTNYVNTSVVRVNGTARTTTFGSGNQLTAALLAGDLANAGTLAITVFTPTPGGGTSNSVNLTVSGPTLTVVPNPVNPSAALTLTLANGAGGAQDWIGLFAAGAPDTAYQSYFYVGAGVTNTVFNKTAPAQAGNYEYRLFINNGYTRTAAAAFTVAISNPVPTITSLSPSTATVGGPTFTLTVNGTNFVNGAIVRLDGSNRTTVFGSATQLTATIPDTDIASGGTHTVTVFNPAPGGGTSNGSTLAVVTVPSSPVPTITSINPTSIPVGSAAQSLTVNGTNYVSTSVVRVNGNARATTFGSANQLTAALLASDFTNAGTLAITVFTPTPGGGTSNSANLTVAGPTLTVAPNPVNPSAALTLTLANGAGGAQDWIGLFAAGAADTAYSSYFYVGGGVTNTVFAKTAPAQAGNYEYRLFLNNGYTKTATAPFTVAVSNPVPAITSLNPFSVISGSGQFTLTVTGTGFVTGAIVKFNGTDRATTFGSATSLTATILAGDIPGPASHTITVVNPAPGGGTSNGATLTVANAPSAPVPAITSINPTSIPVGSAAQSLTVNGSNYVSRSVVRVNGSDRATTFGSANQLTAALLASDFTNAGTLAITVFTSAPGGGTSNSVNLTIVGTTLAINPTSTTPGGAQQLTLTNGLGGAEDWIGLYSSGAVDTAFLSYFYAGAGNVDKVFNVTAPATAGTYDYRYFINNSYTRKAGPTSFTVTGGGGGPQIAVNTTSVAPGNVVSATLTAGAGGASDWLALAAVGAANNSYVRWVYVGSGVTTRTWSVPMPTTAGNYEFRLFSSANAKVATSQPITASGSACADSDADGICNSYETGTGVYVSPTNTGTSSVQFDTDGDSLRDGDEVFGTTAGLDLPGLGVNALKKNLLLEYDWIDDSVGCGSHSHRPNATIINRIAAMFAAAPATNPDGSTGVTVIQDYGQGGVLSGGNLVAHGSQIAGDIRTGFDADFNAIKSANKATNREGYFHYVVFPHDYSTSVGSSGIAELPGDDLVVSMGCFGTNDNIGNTIVHELGHNLNLQHGGSNSCNWKPNYNSVMNYRFQFPGVDTSCNAVGSSGESNTLGYSTGSRASLIEANLTESAGVCGSPAIDWNFSGTITSAVSYDLNRTDENPGSGTSVDNTSCGGTLTTLTDYNDWINLVFNGLSEADFSESNRTVVIETLDPRVLQPRAADPQ